MYIGDTFARQINGKGLRLFGDIDVEAFWQVTGKEIYCARYLLTDSLKRRHVVHKSGADGAAMAWARAGWGGVAPAPRPAALIGSQYAGNRCYPVPSSSRHRSHCAYTSGLTRLAASPPLLGDLCSVHSISDITARITLSDASIWCVVDVPTANK